MNISCNFYYSNLTSTPFIKRYINCSYYNCLFKISFFLMKKKLEKMNKILFKTICFRCFIVVFYCFYIYYYVISE